MRPVRPERPVLLVERANKIARLTISPALEIGLADEAGAPVDLSVVRVEVFDPAGKLARHYSGNVTCATAAPPSTFPSR